jgi:hypothetical protein
VSDGGSYTGTQWITNPVYPQDPLFDPAVQDEGAGETQATLAAKSELLGCNAPGDRLSLRVDVFRRGVSSMSVGVSSKAQFEVSTRSKYYYCQKVLPGDWVWLSSTRICAKKLDAVQPVFFNFPFTIELKAHKVYPLYGPLVNRTNQTDIHPQGYLSVRWNGKGPKGASQCGPDYEIPPAENHQILMRNQPFQEAWGYMDIAHARDTKFVFQDIEDGNTQVHKFRPWNDHVLRTL